MMSLSYRPMQVEDLPAAFAVRFSTAENEVTMQELERDYDITPQSLAEAMQSHVKGWLCEDAGTVVGFAMGDGSNGEVQVVAVFPKYQGNGIGGHLLKLVQDWLFSTGHAEIWLLTSPDPGTRAYGFYRKLGWRATGTFVKDDEVLKLRRGDM